MVSLVWYVSYGSNMDAGRFRYYLEGGRPPHAALTYPGARDPRPPRAARPVWLPGGVYFATRSKTWAGGRALYDPGRPGRAAARAYLITAGQFSDVVAQEMYRAPGTDLDLDGVAAAGRVQIGDGRYETLICAGQRDGAPLITFTSPWTSDDVPLLAPSRPYLRMLGRGLCDGHGWDVPAAARYLAALPGARGAWPAGQIAALLGDPDAPAGLAPLRPGAGGAPRRARRKGNGGALPYVSRVQQLITAGQASPRARIIEMATVTSAAALGLGDRTGRIAPGYDATCW